MAKKKNTIIKTGYITLVTLSGEKRSYPVYRLVKKLKCDFY